MDEATTTLATPVVRLYCAPLVGLCRRGENFLVSEHCRYGPQTKQKNGSELTWLLLASFPHQSDKRIDFMPFKEETLQFETHNIGCQPSKQATGSEGQNPLPHGV